MHRRALVVIIFVGLILMVMVLVTRRRAESSAPDSPSRPSAAAASGSEEKARLRKEIEELRKEAEAQKRRAAKAEAELARLRPDDNSKPADLKSPAKASDWKTRRDGEFAAKVKAVDWKKHVKTLVEYWKEMEKARLEGGSPSMTPDLIAGLTKLQVDMVELAKELGLSGSESMKVYENELLSECWQDAMMQEVAGGTLSEGQLAKLRATSLYTNEPDFDRESGNILEAWKQLVEHNRAYTAATAAILSPDQHALVAQSVSPTFMLSVYAQYSEKSVAGAAGVTDYWLDKFKLPPDQRSAVEAVAAEYVRQQAAIAQTFTNQYGTSLPRDAQFDLLVKTIEAQVAAEKQLASSMHLEPDVAKKLLRGSGSVIKVTK
jgi:hypothetical protein